MNKGVFKIQFLNANDDWLQEINIQIEASLAAREKVL